MISRPKTEKKHRAFLTFGNVCIGQYDGTHKLFVTINGEDEGHKFADLEQIKEWAFDFDIVVNDFWACVCLADNVHAMSENRCPACRIRHRGDSDATLDAVLEFMKEQ